MSRFDDALTAIEQSLADLKEAIARAPSADTSQADTSHAGTSQADDVAMDEAELRAMKAELGEAVRLLEAMQQPKDEQTDEAVS